MVKKNKIFLKLITISIFALVFIFIIFNIYINNHKEAIIQAKNNEGKFLNKSLKLNTSENKFIIYSIKEIKAISEEINREDQYSINLENNKIYTEDYCSFELDIKNFNSSNKYYMEIINDNNKKKYDIYNSTDKYTIKFNNEGKNEYEINIYENENIVASYNRTIYYIKKYEKQFLDELVNKGVCDHLANNYVDYKKTTELMNLAGIKNIRSDFLLAWTIYNGKEYNFKNTDEWVNYLKTNNIKLLPIINGFDPFMKNKSYPSTENDIKLITEFSKKVKENYDDINDYEIYNEPNNYMKNTSEINIYADLVNEIKKINPNWKLVVGDFSQKFEWCYDPFEFLVQIGPSTYKNTYAYSFHYYDSDYKKYNNEINKYYTIINNLGGFTKKYITEYGYTRAWNNNEDVQSKELVKQNISFDLSSIDKSYMYYLVSEKQNEGTTTYDLGIVDEDYTPKKAYYALKNLNTNINGAEYIGSFTLQDGITAYVYDKDGKPKIIIWSDNGEKKIDYTNFKASDLYGNEINPDENNQITVSDSPIYLDNISTDYFYQAISNAITSGYSEFNTKFADEISKVDGLTAKINELNKQAVNLKNVSTFDENKAKELMKEHFELGNMIMSAYENGKLNVEYVKLSSMLDSLNTIGNSYDDLVTVSAKTRITDLTDITNEVNTAKSLAQSNEKFNIVYPNKIYQFAQDFIDTSSYILGLEEQNDIKTGLINSKALHAKYLAEWSQKFSKIYINDALKDSINTITATNSEIKQKYSNILLNNEVSSCYNGISDSIKELSTNIENCNLDNVDSLYNKELDFAKLIANKYYSKELNIKESDFKELEKKLFYTLSSFEGLYKYYVSEDNISQDKVADTLNNIVKLYDENTDIDLSTETEMIKNLKSTYEGLNSVEDSGAKYFEKLNINKTCELISTILEGDIKNKADSEYKAIKATSNTDLSKLTNKDVLISIKIPNDNVNITNNKGSVNITFDENGDFTYEIDIRGYKYTYKVTVNNIDKTRPKLNVTSTGTSIKSTATDDNLKELKVEKDGKTISYKQGEELTTPGIYKITAIDKANNQTTSKEIVYGIFKNTSNNDVKYVPTNANKLKAKTLKENSNFTLKDNNQEIADDANVATGNKLSKDGQEYTIIVKGDITKNGEVGTLDLIALRKNIVGLTKLENEQALAADLDDDGKVNVLDLINERKRMVGIE